MLALTLALALCNPAADSLLPYPRSVVSTGQGGVIFVVSEANITYKVCTSPLPHLSPNSSVLINLLKFITHTHTSRHNILD